MNKKCLAPSSAARPAFTLVEMLVVMGIIGLLVALLMPAIGSARNSAMKAQALNQVKGIETALKNYNVEYGMWPMLQETAPSAPTESLNGGVAVSNQTLYLLLGTNVNGRNPRKLVFLDAAQDNLVGGAYVDPWDSVYRYMCDFDNDGKTVVKFTAAITTNLIGRGAGVWSAGPSGKVTNRADNVTSW